jgi:hypothetical protein
VTSRRESSHAHLKKHFTNWKGDLHLPHSAIKNLTNRLKESCERKLRVQDSQYLRPVVEEPLLRKLRLHVSYKALQMILDHMRIATQAIEGGTVEEEETCTGSYSHQLGLACWHTLLGNTLLGKRVANEPL